MKAPKLTLFHNSQCSKSRAALALLEQSGREFEVVAYLDTPPTAALLDRLLTQLGMGPEQLVRRGEDLYEELGLEKNPPASRSEWIELLINHPVLIERPIVTDGTRTVVGRPPENVKALL